MKVHAYLGFDGRCEQAFAFYEKHLGAKTLAMMAHEGTPMAEHVPPDWGSKILQGQIQIGNQIVMASDVPPGRYERPKGISISLAPTPSMRLNGFSPPWPTAAKCKCRSSRHSGPHGLGCWSTGSAFPG